MRITISVIVMLLTILCKPLFAQDCQWVPMQADVFLEQTIVNPSPVLATEATTTYDTPADNSPDRKHIGNRRNANDPFGGATIDDVDDPKEPGLPVGDVPVGFLLLLAAFYVLYMRLQSRQLYSDSIDE